MKLAPKMKHTLLIAGGVVGAVVIVSIIASAQQKAASLVPASGGTITPDPTTGNVKLQPGNMGTLNIQSGPNGQTVGFMLPDLGQINSVASSNSNVMQPFPTMSVGQVSFPVSATFPGQTVITVTWSLQTGPSNQTSTFTVNAS